MESTLKNMVLTLFVITFVASSAVGLVYQVTKDPIAAAKQAKLSAALGEVLPSNFDNEPSQDQQVKDVDGGQVTIYTAKSGDQVVGYAVETFTMNGFGGRIKLMAGFLPDGNITKIAVLEHAETPGLGNKIEPSKSDFSLQFEGKNPASYTLKVKKDGGDVDAITASTITSRAYLDAVQRAYNTVFSTMKGGANE
ncbi:MAG: RnfABCDGE type electron transport complex subunit G [Rikenellaceae bacterium]